MKNLLATVHFTFILLVNALGQTDDVGVTAINVPEFGTTDFTATYAVQVDVTNFGSANQTNVPITLEITDDADVTTIINETVDVSSGATVQYTFTATVDISAVGSYDIVVYTSLVGDEVPDNDSHSSTVLRVSPATIPVSEDFEGVAAFTKTYTEKTADIDGLTGFSFIPEVPGQNRLRLSYGYALGSSYSAGLDNLSGSEVSKNDLILTIDASGYDVGSNSLITSFYYIDFNDDYEDHDRIYVRGSVADEWVEVFDWGLTNSFSWIEHSFNLSEALASAGQQYSSTTQISFSQEGRYWITSDGLGIEDISIYELLDDLEVVAVSDFILPNASKKPVVHIRNNGSNSQSGFDVTLDLTDENDNTTSTTITVNESIDPFETVTLEIGSAMDFSQFGRYEMEASVDLTGDENTDNDDYEGVLFIVSSTDNDLPLFEGWENTGFSTNQDLFEINGAEGFSFTTPNTERNRACTYCGNYASGNRSFEIEKWTNGQADRSDLVLSMDLSAYTVTNDAVGLSFKFQAETSGYPAGIEDRKVWVRGNENDLWIEVYDWYANHTNREYVEVLDINLSEFMEDMDQDFSSSFQIRFGWHDTYDYEFYLDDIEIRLIPDNDLGIFSVNPPLPNALTSEEEISVDIINRGLDNQSAYDVTIVIEDPEGLETSVTESVTTSIDFSDITTYTFNELFDFSKEGYYDVTATVELAGDQDQSNDTEEVETGTFISYKDGLPYFQDFETNQNIYQYDNSISLTGLPGFAFVNQEYRRNLVYNYSGIQYSGTKSLYQTKYTYTGEPHRSDIYLTMDLSGYDASTANIGLSFQFLYDRGTYAEGEEDRQVFIRGSNEDDWIVLYDWYDNAIDEEWVGVHGLSLSEALIGDGQNFSSTFQIRFGYNMYTSYEFVLDDILVYELPQFDLSVADVYGINSSVNLSSNESLDVDIFNYGLSPQSGFGLDIEILRNGTLVQTASKTVNQTVDPQNDISVNISNLNLDFSQTGSYVVVVSTSIDGNIYTDYDQYGINVQNYDVLEQSLPYFQDFEDVTIDNSEISISPIDNLDGFTYEIEYKDLGNAELRFNTYEHFNNYSNMQFGDAERGLGLINTVYNEFNEHAATITIDYSNFDANKDIIGMDYWYYQGYSYGTSRAYIRGGETDPWIEVNNHYSGYSPINWNEETAIDFSTALINNGQNYSETFQIRFFSKNRYDREWDSFILDNLKIYPLEDIIQLSNQSIPENSQSGKFVGNLSAIGGEFDETHTFSLGTGTGDDDNDKFYISGNKLRTYGGFDFETSDEAFVLIKATDNFSDETLVPFVITITDANDAPTLADQNAGSVGELAPPGTIVGTIAPGNDVDAGQTLSYSIDGTTPFAIDPVTREITIAETSLMNFEERTQEMITVRVTDDGNPVLDGTATITIDILDENDAPTVPDQHIEVDRSVAAGSIGFLNAFDEDAGDVITYALEAGHDGTFSIDMNTGEVTLVNAATINGSSLSMFPVNVEVTDDDIAPKTTVFTLIVYANEGPSMDQATYSFDKEENSDDILIGTVGGTDPNPDQEVDYNIIDGNPDNIFNVNQLGQLYIINKYLFDYERATSHTLTVEINDGGFPTLTDETTVTINVLDVNDYPSLGANELSISENSSSGTLVGTLSVTDQDAGQTASISLEDDPSGLFSFDATSGELTLSQAGLDFETKDEYVITFLISDDATSPLSRTEEVVITVTDINEAPVLPDEVFNLDENSEEGTLIGIVTGSDEDANYELSYIITDDASGYFTINEQNGQIRLGREGLDFEVSSLYDIEVTVTDDTDLTGTATITIDINDVNETPTIMQDDIIVPNTSVQGDIIATLSANDPDLNQTLTYEITDGNEFGIFTIDAASGEISIADQSRFYTVSDQGYPLEITVSDDGDGLLSAKTNFTVYIQITFPVFTDYSFSIPENAVAGKLLGTLSAVHDEGRAITFTIGSGNDLGYFELDANTGELRLITDMLDFEAVASFDLSVIAGYQDSPGNSTTASVSINIEDVNERPVLATAVADWTLTVGDTDLTLDLNGTFQDPDAGDQLSLEVRHVGKPLPDWLDFSGGILTADIDNDDAGIYNFEVTAKDQGNLTVTDEFTIEIIPLEILSLNKVFTGAMIYPNPANDFVKITGLNNGIVNIYSLSGQKLKSVPVSVKDQRVDISDLRKGTYLINIDGNTEWMRFVKN